MINRKLEDLEAFRYNNSEKKKNLRKVRLTGYLLYVYGEEDLSAHTSLRNRPSSAFTSQ